VHLVRRAYVVAAMAWLAALPLGALLASRAHASAIAQACELAIYAIGGAICHQRPERSFHLWSAQLPVCARCSGIYLGAAVATVRAAAMGREGRGERDAARIAVCLAALPTIATLAYEWTTGDVPSNAIRFAAGLPLGAVVSWLVLRRQVEVN